MKILLYSTYRTGSKSLGNWLQIELSMPYYHEYYNKSNLRKWERMQKINLNKIDDYIIKISPNDGFDFDELVKGFDKVILLYREDTLAQAQSMVWAKTYETYHNSYVDGKFKYAHYTIDDKFLIDNSEKISTEKRVFDRHADFLKNANVGLLITYEELYETNMGIKKIEDYLGITAKTKFDKNDKLRNNAPSIKPNKLI
jgi:LPS sulfotransferase NodH